MPLDYILKATAKANFQASTIRNLPIVSSSSVYAKPIIARVIRLNALTENYITIWNECREVGAIAFQFSKQDARLCVRSNSEEWSKTNVFVNDYMRRQALLEIDVLVALAFGLSLGDLREMYELQFHILKSQEADTWYDRYGRIVYTNNRALTGIGFSRREWENGIKDAPAGQKFYRTITDDTQPGGSVQRTIEYVAPFDRCDREEDYEIAWRFFEKRYREE